MVLVLYTITIFLGAALLFLVQPMVAKLVLPLLGGSPAVWNTCMVFFQAALLGGYLGAHLLGKAGARVQVTVYALALAAPVAAGLILGRLIVGLPAGATPPEVGTPIPWLLLLLTVTIGGPFLILAAAGPLLQRWFSLTGHKDAKDPYFLYAASNGGSMLALLGYPLLLEPLLTLRDQRWVWTVGFGAFAVLVAACGVLLRRNAPVAALSEAAAGPAPSWRDRLWWVFLAFIPSSLMLGATQFLSTDIAAVPLLWVVPLALYLLTFILAFSPRVPSQVASISKILPILAVGLAVSFLVQAKHPIWVIVFLHLLALFLGALLCHTRLAKARPHPSRLTEFYLLIAVGGVLGGVFNALAAPVVFSAVHEYPIALALALLVRPVRPWGAWDRLPRALGIAIEIAAPAAVFLMLVWLDDVLWNLGIRERQQRLLIGVGLPAVVGYLIVLRPAGFAVCVWVMLAVAVNEWGADGTRLARERTFFGVYHVNRVGPQDQRMTLLVHGTTQHGLQYIEAPDSRTPLGYYHPDGPIGAVFKAYKDVQDRAGRPLFDHVGLVGLGAGALAAYGEPGRRMTFHEIDPAVVRIAENPEFFTYLRDCKGRYDISLGDGRLTIARVPDGEYGLILLDAFSSDSIPVHLMTREAVELYLRKLKPGGLIAFHISNQYLRLAPVLAAIAADLGLVQVGWDDGAGDEALAAGHYSSHWVVLARDPSDLAPLAPDGRWRPEASPPGAPLWTDDYSNIVSIFGGTAGE